MPIRTVHFHTNRHQNAFRLLVAFDSMLPLPTIIWHEATAGYRPPRQCEPVGTMDDLEQVRSYVEAYAWGGPTSALQLHHLRELSRMIRSGDAVLDLACGPGPLLLELASLYPDCRFVGADLSTTMLEHLRREAAARNLKNLTVLQEDIRSLQSLGNFGVDLVITTSALHHLPDLVGLRQVFRRVRTLLRPGGGFYAFDFGLLRSSKSREIFVAEIAKLAPPLTVRDYDLSLKAAFPIDSVFTIANEELPKPYMAYSSAFVDFLYFLRTPDRSPRSAPAQKYIDAIWSGLSFAMKSEHLMLRWLRRSRRVAA